MATMQSLRDPRILKTGMWVVLLITIPSFVMFYGFSGGSMSANGGYDRPVATVDLPSGERKLMLSEMKDMQDRVANELLSVYMQVNRRPPDQRAASQVTNAISRREIAEYAVGEVAFEKLADEYDIHVTNEQVEQSLREAGVTNEQFNRLLARERLRPGEFLRREGQNMRIARAQKIVASAARPTLPQLWSLYRLENTKVTAEVATLAPPSFADSVTPTDEELAAFFQESAENYQKGEERAYSYVLWAPPTLPLDSAVTDLALQAEYESIDPTQDARFAEAPGATVRQIVRYGVEGDDKVQARALLEQLQARVAAGEDMAALADAYSEDINNVRFDEESGTPTHRGGELEERIAPANRDAWKELYGEAWASLVDTATPGMETSLVDVVGGVALVRVESRSEGGKKPLEQVRALVEAQLLARRRSERDEQIKATVDLNEIQMRKAAEENTGLEGLAKALNLEVKTTSPTLTLQYSLPGVASLSAHAEVLEDLEKGEISPVLRLAGSNNLVVVRVEDVIAARPQTLDEVRERVVQDYKSRKSLEVAREKANLLAERLRTGDTITSAVAALELPNVTPRTISEPFALSAPPPDLQNAQRFPVEAANAKTGDVIVVESGFGEDFVFGVVVARLTSVEQPDRTEFLTESANIERGLTFLRADAFAQAYRDNFVKTAKVDYDQDFIAEAERRSRRRSRE